MRTAILCMALMVALCWVPFAEVGSQTNNFTIGDCKRLHKTSNYANLNSFENSSSSVKKCTHISLSYHSIKSSGYAFQAKLSYVGHDLEKLPPIIPEVYGAKVDTLDLSYNNLTTLQGLEYFLHLKELILDNNGLSDNITIPKMQTLHTLSINKNKICNLELFLQKVQNSMPSIRYLSLLGNKACPDQLSDINKDEDDYRRYRYYVLNQLPHLQFLDSTPVTCEEQEEARRRGHLMNIVKPLTTNVREDFDVSPISTYTPLPRTRREIGDHQGAYGKCRYRYSGKHSEGNRFIQNNDL